MNDMRVKIGGDTSGFELSMAKVRGAARSMAKDISGSIGGRIAGLFTIGAIGNAIQKTAEYAGSLVDLSTRTGVAVESLQRLDKAARENGTSLDSLVGLWERVGSAREDALRDKKSGAAKAFGALGVDSGMLQTAKPDEIVRKIAASFQNSANVEQLIAPLREIGGRGAGQMIALFRAGLDQQYQDMQVMTGEQADLLDELDDKFSTLGQTMSIRLAPVLVWLIDKLREIPRGFDQTGAGMGAAYQWLVDNQGKGIGFKDMLSGVWDAFTEGVLEESGIQEEQKAAEDKARAERVKNRKLGFGNSDFSNITDGKEKKEKFSVREMALDDLSKAGLFAGGAGSKGINNVPERQLQAAEKLLVETQKTNRILEEAL